MIYLTEEEKEKLEANIAELEKYAEINCKKSNEKFYFQGKATAYKEILSISQILPEEKSWSETLEKSTNPLQLKANYPNGVIINPNL